MAATVCTTLVACPTNVTLTRVQWRPRTLAMHTIVVTAEKHTIQALEHNDIILIIFLSLSYY